MSKHHPITVIEIDAGQFWNMDSVMRAPRGVVRRTAQALADSTGRKVRTTRGDSTAFTRTHTPKGQ